MHLRPFQPGEETKLWELVQGPSARAHPAVVHEDWAHWMSCLQAKQSFIVEYDHQVIGYVDLGRDGGIDHFFVRDAWQGRGIGTLLMRKVLQQAVEQGVSEIFAQVCPDAEPFFTYWGFVPSANQHTHPDSDDVLMRKDLAA